MHQSDILFNLSPLGSCVAHVRYRIVHFHIKLPRRRCLSVCTSCEESVAMTTVPISMSTSTKMPKSARISLKDIAP